MLTAAISAIDIALHDLVAKSLGIPVYQLLGGAHRHHIPVFVTSHATMGEDAVEAAKRFKQEGWPCVRGSLPSAALRQLDSDAHAFVVVTRRHHHDRGGNVLWRAGRRDPPDG